MKLRTMDRPLIREHAERHANGRDNCGHASEILALAHQIEATQQGGHYDHKGKHLAQECHPSDRAIITAAVNPVLLGHPDDTFGQSWDDGFKLGKFFWLRERSNPQFATLSDNRALPAFLKLGVLLELAFEPISLRQAVRLRRTAAEAGSGRRWQLENRWQP